MLLTISTSHRPATDLGYLLHKHPDRFQSFELSFGQAHVFYPEVSDERTTAHPSAACQESLFFLCSGCWPKPWRNRATAFAATLSGSRDRYNDSSDKAMTGMGASFSRAYSTAHRTSLV